MRRDEAETKRQRRDKTQSNVANQKKSPLKSAKVRKGEDIIECNVRMGDIKEKGGGGANVDGVDIRNKSTKL